LRQPDGKLVSSQKVEAGTSEERDKPTSYVPPSNLNQCPSAANAFHWQFIPISGQPGTYMIKNKVTGLCLDARGDHRNPTDPIKSIACTAFGTQLWTIRTPPQHTAADNSR